MTKIVPENAENILVEDNFKFPYQDANEVFYSKLFI